MRKSVTFSARLNDDGSWRGMVWDASHEVKSPLLIVGHSNGEYFYSRKDAIRAAKQRFENPPETKRK